MFGEILNLAKFIREIIVERSDKVKGWKKVYSLYCSLERVIDRSVTASHNFSTMPLDPYFLEHSRSKPSEIRWIGITNENFKRLDEAVVSFVADFSEVKSVLEIYDNELAEKLVYHFNFKMGWISTFIWMYHSGIIEADGKRITRTATSIVKKLKEDFSMLSDPVFESLIFGDEIDISTHEKREKLIQIGQQNIEGLKKVKLELGEFIKEHCKIEDLL